MGCHCISTSCCWVALWAALLPTGVLAWREPDALALVGALGRRAVGQPAMSRQRMWRVAIGLTLLAILLIAALLGSSSGGGGG